MICTHTPACSAEPSLYFGEPEYFVDESSGYVEVKVWRTGTDLSKTATVTVRSRKSEPVSAEGTDSVDQSVPFEDTPHPTLSLLQLDQTTSASAATWTSPPA